MGDVRTCSICGKKFSGDGNNASPVNDGICCDECNSDVVVPRRIRETIDACEVDIDICVDKCIKFVKKFNGIKHWLTDEAMELEIKLGVEEFEKTRKSDLFNEATSKLIGLATNELSESTMVGLSLWFTEYLGEDMDVVYYLYEKVHGYRPHIEKFN